MSEDYVKKFEFTFPNLLLNMNVCPIHLESAGFPAEYEGIVNKKYANLSSPFLDDVFLTNKHKSFWNKYKKQKDNLQSEKKRDYNYISSCFKEMDDLVYQELGAWYKKEIKVLLEKYGFVYYLDGDDRSKNDSGKVIELMLRFLSIVYHTLKTIDKDYKSMKFKDFPPFYYCILDDVDNRITRCYNHFFDRYSNEYGFDYLKGLPVINMKDDDVYINWLEEQEEVRKDIENPWVYFLVHSQIICALLMECFSLDKEDLTYFDLIFERLCWDRRDNMIDLYRVLLLTHDIKGAWEDDYEYELLTRECF